MKALAARTAPYVCYPLFFGLAIAGFALLLKTSMPLVWATYIPIATVASILIFMEWRDPLRPDWRPRLADVKADAAFMLFVQVLMARLITLAAIFLVADLAAANPHLWWPHAAPLALQVILMLVIVDFLRYWLHRACHRYDVLWRLHEVHHSPDLLYTLNVGRFHPLEKALQIGIVSLPFMALGVAPEVLAGYYLLYSVHGFFQHSNLRLFHGWLNFVVASAELHRWHHARDPKTAACNFSNTTVVWDLLFGTWYLPTDRKLDDIGILDRAYPKGFWAQMGTPFRRRNKARNRWREGLANVLSQMVLRAGALVHLHRVRQQARDPMRIQTAVLARILHDNRDTQFGRQHDFAGITDHRQFMRNVPVAEFEDLRPYIEAQIERAVTALTREPPLRYVRTSGTTGKAKDIPLTPTHLARLRTDHRAGVALQFHRCPQAFAGAILAITSPAEEGRLSNGLAYGSASGIVAGDTAAVLREKFVVPAEVLTLTDSRVKYLLILRLAMARPDITYAGTANPGTFLTLIALYRQYQAQLLADLAGGGFFLRDQVPAIVWQQIERRLAPCPERAAALRACTALRIADLWPELRLIVTWTCGSAGVSLEALRRELAPRTRIHELGYLSSEFRGTITLGRRAGSGFPTLASHFFEFVERALWDDGTPHFLTLDQLRKGVDYYVFVTTPSGLYRYFINDLVRVTGHFYRTPLLKFLQKGKGVTNITGEKLYEAQLLDALRGALAPTGRAACFVMALADEEQRCYQLYVESDAGPRPDAQLLAQAVDARLSALNIEYAAKRESLRLAPLRANWLQAGSAEAYKRFCVERGQREGQFKSVALAYRRSFDFNLDAHVVNNEFAACH